MAEETIYTVFTGELEGLAEEVTSFCIDSYGDKCEFSNVEIERVHPDDHSWKVHAFSSFDERAAKAIQNHLKTRRDVVNLKFGDIGNELLKIMICPARNTSKLARHMDKEERERLSEDDLVLLALDRDSNSIEKVGQLFESLE